MKSRTLVRRLERLEAVLALDDSDVLRVTITRIGKPESDKVIEVRLPKPDGWRRRRWQKNDGRG